MKSKHVPMRRCIGCMESKPKQELIRIVASDDDIRVDASGKANGRGLYICPSLECLAKAKKNNGIKRSLKMNVDSDVLERLEEEMKEYEK